MAGDLSGLGDLRGLADLPGLADAGTITYALARSAPERGTLSPRRRSVPPEWHARLRLALGARERLRDATVEPLVGAFVVPGSYDDPEAGLSLVATAERALERVAELVPSIPLDLDLVDESTAETGPGDVPDDAPGDAPGDPYQLSTLDPAGVPGGVVCESAMLYGTLTPALFDAESGRRFFATSNHIFGAGGTEATDHAGEALRLRSFGRSLRVGSVRRGYPTADVVQVAPADGVQPAPALARADSGGVVGQYTTFGLADLAARDEPLTKYGAVSDRTSGQIRGVDGVTCYTGRVCKTGQLTWGGRDTLVDGDSGSVAFHPDPENPDEYALVAGVNNARTRWIGDFTWGTAAHHLLDAYGLHF